MTNNDVLRRIRYIFDFNDAKMIAIFALADLQVKRGDIIAWLLKDDDPAYEDCNGRTLATFLNGLISEKRGKRPGPQPEPEHHLTNNIVLMKLKIALNLQSEDIIAMVTLGGFRLSAPELSSFMRRPGHRNYRECKDQVLRYFLKGLQVKYRGEQVESAETAESTKTPTANSPYAKWIK
ncbi:DUF1456 family protein [Halieaceae bacterium IMCC14734]|uniref:DUF1456 family protein n=2 Tax=Candidatus Litorirhabdus singularis TaxID=2518993 RepID=A0ABT3TFM6_9GAMM|nr:DUF1456 family protein [Candidatus Litorirhabdus singularis]